MQLDPVTQRLFGTQRPVVLWLWLLVRETISKWILAVAAFEESKKIEFGRILLGRGT